MRHDLTSGSVQVSVLAFVLLTIAPDLAWAAPSAALSTQQCMDADTRAQELRRDGALSAAIEQLRVCTASDCPALVRSDCTRRLDETLKAQPTIAFEFRGADGGDVSGVTVVVDGKPATVAREGAAMPADIGRHEFLFMAPGRAAVTKSIVLVEGEKGRRERVAMATVATPAGRPRLRTSQWIGLGSMFLGAAGVGVGGVFGAMALSEKGKQVAACGSAGGPCDPAQNYVAGKNAHGAAESDGLISTVGFVAGAAVAAAGVFVFFATGHRDEPKPTAGLLVVPAIGPNAGSLVLSGEF